MEIQGGEWHSRTVCFSLSAPKKASLRLSCLHWRCTKLGDTYFPSPPNLPQSPGASRGTQSHPAQLSPDPNLQISPAALWGDHPLSTALAKIKINSNCSQELPELQLDAGGKLNPAHKGLHALQAARGKIQGKDSQGNLQLGANWRWAWTGHSFCVKASVKNVCRSKIWM